MYLHINKAYDTLLHVNSFQTPQFFEAVFFDMDGLFVDSEPLWFESEAEITAPFGYVWRDEDQVACLGGPLSRVGEYMSEKCNHVESPSFFTNTLIEIQSAKLRGKTPLMPGASELLQQLQSQNIATGLVSASPRSIVNAVLENLGGNPFSFTISSNDVINTKPHPDPYLLAAKKAGAEITKCLVFEDSLTGVDAAKSSGAWLIAVPHLVNVPEEARVRSIKSLDLLSYDKLQELFKDFTTTI